MSQNLINEGIRAICSLEVSEARPLILGDSHRQELRNLFIQLGFNPDIVGRNRVSLTYPNYFGILEPGMKDFLGERNVLSFKELCYNEGENGSGMMEFATRFVGFVVLPTADAENSLIQANKLILRWWIQEANSGRVSQEQLTEVILERFKDAVACEYPGADIMPCYPEVVWTVWQFLSGTLS